MHWDINSILNQVAKGTSFAHSMTSTMTNSNWRKDIVMFDSDMLLVEALKYSDESMTVAMFTSSIFL